MYSTRYLVCRKLLHILLLPVYSDNDAALVLQLLREWAEDPKQTCHSLFTNTYYMYAVDS